MLGVGAGMVVGRGRIGHRGSPVRRTTFGAALVIVNAKASVLK